MPSNGHLLAPLLAGDIKCQFAKHKPLPSKSMLSKTKVLIDAAFMLHKRQTWQDEMSKASVFLMADSSPQFGQDWFITEIVYIQENNLEAVFDAVAHIHYSCTTLLDMRRAHDAGHRLDKTGAIAINETISEASEELQPLLVTHMFPPSGLGKRRGSLPHKVHALLHSLWLDNGSWQNVERTGPCAEFD